MARRVDFTVYYRYDKEGNLTKKVVTHADGTEQTVYYETTDGNTVAKFVAGESTVTFHSKTDTFGRKLFEELQFGTGVVSRSFDYYAGEASEAHRDNAKIKSSPITQLVSLITMADGSTLAYAYDAEERITSVTHRYEVVENEWQETTTTYTYDALGQLLTETVTKDGVSTVVSSMEYDNYGNILSKNGKAYTYGDGVWKDLLTEYDGQTISYDAQGNPTSYLGHTLTWEKGRQLKSFDGNTYTYNANGIRTSKTVNGVLHTYTLDGTKILREEWDEEEYHTLIPLYDNEDSVCGIVYNDVPYFFLKNLQGDVIAIANARGEVEARYSYDAWGVCTIVSDTTDGIGSINPYRYRGYYYDAEIGLYYVLSRYYDSEIGRFINTDNCVCLGTGEFALNYNLFSYCLNNPANMSDASGEIPVWVVYAVAGAALFGGVTYVIGKALGITGKALTILTAALAAVGATAAAILGVKFLAKVSPKLAKWAQTVAKNTKVLKPSYKHSSNQKTSLGGLILFDAFKIMLHPPHNNQHNYFHIQIEVKLPGIKMPWIKFRIKINPTKWIS